MGVFVKEYKLKDGTLVRKRAIRWYVWEGKKDEKGRKVFKPKTSVLGDIKDVSTKQAKATLKVITDDQDKKNKSIKYGAPLLLGDYGPRFVQDKKNDGKKVWKIYEERLPHLTAFFGDDKQLNGITIDDIKDYKKARLEKVKPSTCNRELQCLRHMLNYAVRSKHLVLPEGNPVLYEELLDEVYDSRRPLTIDEWFAFDKSVGEPARFVFRNDLYTGMRIGETIDVLEDDLRLDDGYIILRGTITKGGESRKVAVDDMAKQNIREALAYRNLIKDGNRTHVFVNKHGKPYKSRHGLYRTLKRHARKLGIKGISLHSLRHTFATWSLNEDANIVGIQHQLGHSKVETTKRYARPDRIVHEAQTKVTNYIKKQRVQMYTADSEDDELWTVLNPAIVTK